jgi:hypothetical protein
MIVPHHNKAAELERLFERRIQFAVMVIAELVLAWAAFLRRSRILNFGLVD